MRHSEDLGVCFCGPSRYIEQQHAYTTGTFDFYGFVSARVRSSIAHLRSKL
jgi:hypothetical protein